ncbi:K02A2.6-like [Cordylochernes scorpioides]|uniref:K02A2.6-like n=1 Tax=Cordylochernes scorpioides TaxID=51811 RepID=A0ABY6LW98_9ARAC|nr:K02A2.6-like [Cordylochernes scorpioides]
MLMRIFEAQQEDTTLKAVVNYLEQGWPDKKKISQALLSYWHVKDELGFQNGLLMRSCRLVIPASMKLEILDKLHAGHIGITQTRIRARETQKIGMDLFKFENKWYLVVIDYYSRFPEMIQLDWLTANVVVRSCKSIFARHGIPETVVSDNGTQFGTAREFANFARQYRFTHVTSSPRFPQSNGMAEAGVKIAKLILKKNQDPSPGLLEYRSTPLENGYSPAELLMGRKLRTTLPIAPENLNPKLVDSQTLKRKEGRRRKDMKSRYDRCCGARDMEELSEGLKNFSYYPTPPPYSVATAELPTYEESLESKILEDEERRQFIRKLPQDYDGIVQVLYRLEEKQFNVENIEAHLINESGRVQQKKKDNGLDIVANAYQTKTPRMYQGNKKKNYFSAKAQYSSGSMLEPTVHPRTARTHDIRNCSFCGKTGHLLKDCFLRNKNSQWQHYRKDQNYKGKSSAFHSEILSFHHICERASDPTSELGEWLIDSAATSHFCKEKDWFVNYQDIHPMDALIGNVDCKSTILVSFLFNWVGFVLLLCFCHTLAGRYGALAGFGLSLAKWTLIVKDRKQQPTASISQGFQRSSGIRVIFRKSVGLWCGAWRARVDSPLEISWNNTCLRMLGCDIRPRASAAIQEGHLLDLLNAGFRRWAPFTRGLSLVGRARAANCLVLSSFMPHLHGYIPADSSISSCRPV